MKTISTFKNRLTLHLFFLSVMFLIISAPLMSQVKHVVNVSDFKFTPNELQISVGDTIEWQNTQGYHNVNGTTVTFPLNPESFGNSAGFNWTYKHVFNTIGIYDYHCDPHALGGMVGKIEVKESNGNDDKYNLTINFMGMTPHVDQILWLEVVDKESEKEVERKKQIVSTDFSVDVSGIEKDHSYFVNFYADHNGNGSYDTPPVDHAWQLELNDVMGDTTLNFQHNTSFTDINWIATAVSELNKSLLKMYPNPAIGRVFIESNEFNSTVVKVMIYDISGKLKISKILSPKQILEIDVHELVNGMYFVELSNEYKREMLKLIKY